MSGIISPSEFILATKEGRLEMRAATPKPTPDRNSGYLLGTDFSYRAPDSSSERTIRLVQTPLLSFMGVRPSLSNSKAGSAGLVFDSTDNEFLDAFWKLTESCFQKHILPHAEKFVADGDRKPYLKMNKIPLKVEDRSPEDTETARKHFETEASKLFQKSRPFVPKGVERDDTASYLVSEGDPKYGGGPILNLKIDYVMEKDRQQVARHPNGHPQLKDVTCSEAPPGEYTRVNKVPADELLNLKIGTHDPAIAKYGKRKGVFVLRPAYWYCRKGSFAFTTYFRHGRLDEDEDCDIDDCVVDPASTYEDIAKKRKAAEEEDAVACKVAKVRSDDEDGDLFCDEILQD